MTYTQEQLEEMSNHKINHVVRRIKYGSHAYDPGIYKRKLDYCNDWAALGPLIVEAKISLEYFSLGVLQWRASSSEGYSGHSVSSQDPLRAAAIVYILVKQQ